MAKGDMHRVSGDIVVDTADGPISADHLRDSVGSRGPGAVR